MEHLDLAGYITTPTYWTMPAFEQQDAIYLSNSRQMLEPIQEETSEDEEHAQNSWHQYDQSQSFWSSAESDTGSVIRIELNKDADSISERDFACPPKRARHSDDFSAMGLFNNSQPSSLDDTVILRRHHRPYTDSEATNSLERFLAYEAAARDSFGNQPLRNSTGSRRFDEFNPTDNDGFTSLSRSSSLVQFESLEKQLMLSEQHASMSSLGNSSPSLLSFDGANTQSSGNLEEGARNSGNNSGNSSRRGSQSSLMKRFDASDGRLHQTYYELNKLNFDDDEQQQIQFTKLAGNASKSSTLESGTGSSISESKSDSESSTTSDSCDSSSSAQSSILRAAADSLQQQDAQQKKNARMKSFQRAGKSSAENLSEDSGYCEPSMLSRAKSKSIPKNFEKFCEEDEEEEVRFENFSDDEVRVDEDDVEEAADNQHSRHDNDIFENASTTTSALDATFIVTECMELEQHINNNIETTTATAIAAVPHTFLVAKNSLDEMSVDIAAGDCSDASSHVDCIRSHTTTDTGIDSHHSHSPSPDSSLGSSHSSTSTQSTRSSTTTAETCASAGSFTWHRQHRHEREDTEQPSSNFFASHRNSLPDIREACTTNLDTTYSSSNSATSSIVSSSAASSALQSQSSSPSAATACRNRLDFDGFVNYSNKNVLEGLQATSSNENIVESVASKNFIEQFVARGRCAARHSLPNELNKLGRRKKRVGRQSKQQQQQHQQAQLNAYDSSSSGTESDYFVSLDLDQLKLRRSCSWSERQSKSSSPSSAAAPTSPNQGDNAEIEFGKLLEPQQTALSFGYMNASYHNLTLLDYSDKPNQRSALSNIKRSGNMTSKRHSSKDYEDIICKGNFLLDELSEIYDRNASILNDKPDVEELLEPDATDSSSGSSYVERLETCVEQLIVAPTKESLASTMPKPPPRQRSAAHAIAASEPPDADYADGGQVQHVQLTIRKPPARLKRNGVQTNSMQETENPIFSTFGKTFDQDPTNLRTSYAQSLEKCNFDAKEVSTGDLKPRANMPKRRFHSHANATKKRNMVSSTPNLNAFDPRADELEDDIYVSSAHNSMHQLPQSQAQKPLGILLPAGSRSSFGKEVSFCPVVSKYCWQEQSSEECNEPTGNIVDEDDVDQNGATATLANGHDMLAKAEESSDDELLDNADATVIYNTRENELIAERYHEELQQKQQEQMHLREIASEEQKLSEQLREQEQATRAQEISAQLIASEQRATENIASTTPFKQANTTASETSAGNRVSNTQTPATTTTQQQATISQVLATKQVTTQSAASVKRHKNERLQDSPQSETKNQSRPFSLQLPILSEPPINREHHILYASQQMLDHFQRQEQQAVELEKTQQVSQSVQNLSANNSNLFKQKAKMSLKSKSGDGEVLGADGSTFKPHNNNNEVMKTKFKADEKHPNSKGFFTRFASGFRFSLRRNKNKKLQQQQQQQVEHVKTLEPQLTITTAAPAAVNGKAKKGQQQLGNKQEQQQQLIIKQQSQKSSSSSQQQQTSPTTTSTTTNENFIYIPLKGPLPADYKRAGSTTTTSGNTTSNNSSHNTSQASTASARSNSKQQQQIGGKTLTDNNQNNGKVLGKPPIPKQPPRATTLAGYSQSATTNPTAAQQLTYYYQQQQQQQGDEVDLAATTANFTTQALLDSERSFYYDDFKNQLNSGGMHANNELQAFAAGGIASTSSPSRGSVSQKTQMFNQLGGNGAQNHQVIAAHQNGRNNASKIGLIETDLDTHETVITGKTRSLMDITSGPHGNKRFVIDKRLHIAGGGDNVDIDGVGSGADAYDGYENDADGGYEVMVDANGVVVSKKTTSSGNQIASVRRPHKSMEFLLDKENQKNVLVRIRLI